MNAESSKGENVNNQIFEFYVDIDHEQYEVVKANTWGIEDARLILCKGNKVVAVFNVWRCFKIQVKETAEPNPIVNYEGSPIDVKDVERIVECIMSRGMGNA